MVCLRVCLLLADSLQCSVATTLRSMASNLLLTLVALTSFSFVLSFDCDRGTSDGCSIPFKLPFFFKDTFIESCHRHDQCYFCGGDFNLSREDCDKRFYNNLKYHCDAMDATQKPFCEAVRASYFAAVRLGGGLSFRKVERSWCKESWVRQCV